MYNGYKGPMVGSRGLESYLIHSLEKVVRSPAECALQCTSTSHCKAFSHFFGESKCEIYTKGSKKNSRQESSFDLYVKRNVCNAFGTVTLTTSTVMSTTTSTLTADARAICISGQYKLTAPDAYRLIEHQVGFPYLAVLSVEICARLCTASVLCKAFSFSPQERMCALAGSDSAGAVKYKAGYTHYVNDSVACTADGPNRPGFGIWTPVCESGLVGGDENAASCECGEHCKVCTLDFGGDNSVSVCTTCTDRRYLLNGECVGAMECISEGMIPIAPSVATGFYCVGWP
jgi:hypothetical protein